MKSSLSKLLKLPETTRVFCGHEYTAGRFGFGALFFLFWFQEYFFLFTRKGCWKIPRVFLSEDFCVVLGGKKDVRKAQATKKLSGMISKLQDALRTLFKLNPPKLQPENQQLVFLPLLPSRFAAKETWLWLKKVYSPWEAHFLHLHFFLS